MIKLPLFLLFGTHCFCHVKTIALLSKRSLTCWSADIMASLCGVCVRVRVCVSVRVNDFSSKTTRPRDMLFFLKIAYLSRMKNCSRHADLFVRLFARAIISEVPPTLSVKISTLYLNFLSDWYRDFFHILHICTRPQVDSLV